MRTFDDWLGDAQAVMRDLTAARKRQTELAKELRSKWGSPGWTPEETGYANWNECLQAELGMTASQLRDRNYYARQKVRRVSDGTEAQTITNQTSTPLIERLNRIDDAIENLVGDLQAIEDFDRDQVRGFLLAWRNQLDLLEAVLNTGIDEGLRRILDEGH